jgi:hypothetical protein
VQTAIELRRCCGDGGGDKWEKINGSKKGSQDVGQLQRDKPSQSFTILVDLYICNFLTTRWSQSQFMPNGMKE